MEWRVIIPTLSYLGLLLVWGDSMTKATYKKEAFNRGLLRVSESESIITMVGCVAADRQVCCWISSWELVSSQQVVDIERRGLVLDLGLAEILEISKLTNSATAAQILPQGHTS